MCDITDRPTLPSGSYWANPLDTPPDGTFTILEHNPDTDELTCHILDEKQITLDNKFYDKKGKFFCKHPGTDWHLMEVPQGQALLCPAQTTFKVVYDA